MALGQKFDDTEECVSFGVQRFCVQKMMFRDTRKVDRVARRRNVGRR